MPISRRLKLLSREHAQVFVDFCENVRYDLAEAWGLPWVMEVKVIIGSTVAITRAVDRNRSLKAATWRERLVLDIYANRRVDAVKLVVCACEAASNRYMENATS